MKSIATTCFAVLSATILGASTAHGQARELFTPLSADQARDISPGQNQRVEKIRQRATTASVTLVRVDADVLKGQNTRVTLPQGKTLDFSKSSGETRGANDFTWSGALAGVPGKATFVVRDGNITGSIRDDGT